MWSGVQKQCKPVHQYGKSGLFASKIDDIDSLRSMKLISLIKILSGAAICIVCVGCLGMLFQLVEVSVHPQVMGSVVDSKTNKPIAGATIEFIGSDYGGGVAKSTSSGAYDLPPVYHSFPAILTWDIGFYSEIECSAVGYHSQRERLPSGTGSPNLEHDILHIDFELERAESERSKRSDPNAG